MTARVTKTFGSSVLLWFREDVSRETARDYWRGPHGQIVARTPGFAEYRQHHFSANGAGLWPTTPGTETVIPDARRIDGMPEVLLAGPLAPMKGRAQSKQVFRDEANVFGRTVLYATLPWAGRSYDLRDRGKAGARSVVLLRRRTGLSAKAFAAYVTHQLGPALADDPAVHELRTQVFMPWKQSLWDTPGVAHDNPPETQFHASIVIGFADTDAMARYFGSPEVAAMSAVIAEHCAAVHAYPVEATYAYVVDGRVTLPQVAPVPKPALAPVRRILPPVPTRATQPTSATPFPPARLLKLSGHGPEDVVADADGRLVCSLADGRIVRVDPATGVEDTIGDTGGRPLGLEVEGDGRLLVCDARRGLLRLDPVTGSLEVLVREVEDIPLRFCSNATAAQDGTIWFTESTSGRVARIATNVLSNLSHIENAFGPQIGADCIDTSDFTA